MLSSGNTFNPPYKAVASLTSRPHNFSDLQVDYLKAQQRLRHFPILSMEEHGAICNVENLQTFTISSEPRDGINACGLYKF